MAAINEVIEQKVFSTFGEQLAVNTLHFLVTAITGVGATDAEIAVNHETIYAPLTKGVMSSAALYYGLQVQKIFPAPPRVAAATVLLQGVGLVAGDPLPKQVCGILTKRTAFAGRTFRGRIYLPFPSETDNAVDSTPTPGYLANLAFWVIALQGNILTAGAGGTNTLRHILFHRATGGFDFVTSAVARDKWATQRRRGAYGRPNVPPF